MTMSWTIIKLRQVRTSWPVAHLRACVFVRVNIWSAGPSSDNSPSAHLPPSQFFYLNLARKGMAT